MIRVALLFLLATSIIFVRAEIDIDELLFKRGTAGPNAGTQDEIMVLISFSLPPESLSRLARDASHVGVPLILRGLHERSVAKTMALIDLCDPQRQADWQVDPRIFRHLETTSVPVFAVQAGGAWTTVSGDVSLDYALRAISQYGTPAGFVAAKYLALLEE